jgi:hypothetical protein
MSEYQYLEVAFRYPKDAIDIKALRRYAVGRTLEIRSTGRDVIVAVSVESDGESFDPADGRRDELRLTLASTEVDVNVSRVTRATLMV